MRAAMLMVAAMLALAGCVSAPAMRDRPAAPHEPAQAGVSAVPTPPALRPIAGLVAARADLSQFRSLAEAGGLAALVAGHGPVTLIAPTDTAFARLAPGTVAALLQPGNRPSLRHLLRFWVVTRPIGPTAYVASGGLPTLDGEPLTLMHAADATVLVDAAGRRALVTGSADATDGVLLSVDGIVAPRSIEPGAGAAIGR